MKAETTSHKATEEGDLSMTKKDLAEDLKALAALHVECIAAAKDYDAANKSRAEELRPLEDAERIIKEKTGGAESIAYDLNQVSFAQVRSSTSMQLSSRSDLVTYEVVRFVR